MAYGNNGKVYVFGGTQAYFDTRNDTLEYDIESQTCTILAIDVKPVPRNFTAMSYIGNNTILLFGGGNSDFLGDTWLFDTTTNTWTEYITDGAYPSRREGHAIANIEDGKAIMFYGINEDYTDLNDYLENFDFMWEFTLPDEWGAVE